MAKKSRRVRRQQAARPPSTPTPAAPSPQPVAAPQVEVASAATPPTRKQVDFRAEYQYVISDLRSMAVIALAMLVVLIVLSFVIG